MGVSIEEHLQCHNSSRPTSSRCLTCLLSVSRAVEPLDAAGPCMLGMQLHLATTGVYGCLFDHRGMHAVQSQPLTPRTWLTASSSAGKIGAKPCNSAQGESGPMMLRLRGARVGSPALARGLSKALCILWSACGLWPFSPPKLSCLLPGACIAGALGLQWLSGTLPALPSGDLGCPLTTCLSLSWKAHTRQEGRHCEVDGALSSGRATGGELHRLVLEAERRCSMAIPGG